MGMGGEWERGGNGGGWGMGGGGVTSIGREGRVSSEAKGGDGVLVYLRVARRGEKANTPPKVGLYSPFAIKIQISAESPPKQDSASHVL